MHLIKETVFIYYTVHSADKYSTVKFMGPKHDLTQSKQTTISIDSLWGENYVIEAIIFVWKVFGKGPRLIEGHRVKVRQA
ncbi:hypothetical protein SAMN05216320_107228 [Duganella sp. OV458]|nr:hypothetical protein SAMN05216320_107228 [Duganella sp. OV458]SDK10703.1 hypothetical protein SAMN05428973_108228 [Duganella sp. OV510]